MGDWKDLNDWFESKIFPKTNSKEIRITKFITIHSVIGSAIITFGGVLMGVGVSFMTLGVSFQSEYLSSSNSTEKDQILFTVGKNMIDRGQDFLNDGIGVMIIGILLTMYLIIREK